MIEDTKIVTIPHATHPFLASAIPTRGTRKLKTMEELLPQIPRATVTLETAEIKERVARERVCHIHPRGRLSPRYSWRDATRLMFRYLYQKGRRCLQR